MRTGAATGHTGYFHEAAFYGSDEEYVGAVGPFLRGGVDAGEPTIAACSPRNVALLRRSVDLEGVQFLPDDRYYLSPAATIRELRHLFGQLVAAGGRQIRIVGDVPLPDGAGDWYSWGRYEAAVNQAFAELPVWGLCPYDTRLAPETVLQEVVCTHPRLHGADGSHRPNAGYVDPAEYLAGRPPPRRDPLLNEVPQLTLVDPSAAQMRAAAPRDDLVRAVGPSTTNDLLLAASEAVTNAHVHGRPPVRFELWIGDGRAVAMVTDAGAGPADPLAGLLPPAPGAVGGRGLWIAHQLCTEVIASAGTDGFEVRLSVTAPHAI